MSCVVAAVQVPRLAGARSCCPSRADSVPHWAHRLQGTAPPFGVVPML